MFDGDPPRLVVREHLRLPGFVGVVARVEVGERLPVGVPDDVAARHSVCSPGRREAARSFCQPAQGFGRREEPATNKLIAISRTCGSPTNDPAPSV
jgi:hypothetical protein